MVDPVPRTDENGRQLKALLDHLLDGVIDSKDLIDALGVSSSTYYRRIKETDYPNAEELRRIADRFDLSYPELQVQFGLMSRQEIWNYVRVTDGAPTCGATTATPQRSVSVRPPAADPTVAPTANGRQKLAELAPRLDAPPL